MGRYFFFILSEALNKSRVAVKIECILAGKYKIREKDCFLVACLWKILKINYFIINVIRMLYRFESIKGGYCLDTFRKVAKLSQCIKRDGAIINYDVTGCLTTLSAFVERLYFTFRR